MEVISGPLSFDEEKPFWNAVQALKAIIDQYPTLKLNQLIEKYNELTNVYPEKFRMKVDERYMGAELTRSTIHSLIQTNIAVEYSQIGNGDLEGFFDNNKYKEYNQLKRSRGISNELINYVEKGATALPSMSIPCFVENLKNHLLRLTQEVCEYEVKKIKKQVNNDSKNDKKSPDQGTDSKTKKIPAEKSIVFKLLEQKKQTEEKDNLIRLLQINSISGALDLINKFVGNKDQTINVDVNNLIDRQKQRYSMLIDLHKNAEISSNNGPELHEKLKKEGMKQLEHMNTMELFVRVLNYTPTESINYSNSSIKSLFTHMLFEIIQTVGKLPNAEGGSNLSTAKLKFGTLIKTSIADALFFIFSKEDRIEVRKIVGFEPGVIDGNLSGYVKKGQNYTRLQRDFIDFAVNLALGTMRINLSLLENSSEEEEVYPNLFHNAPRKAALIKPYTDSRKEHSYIVLELRRKGLNTYYQTIYDEGRA